MIELCPVCSTQRIGNFCHNCSYNYNSEDYSKEKASIALSLFSESLNELIHKEITDDLNCLHFIVEKSIKENNSLRMEINQFLLKGDYKQPLILVKDYLNTKEYIVRTCRNCNIKNIVSTSALLESNCYNCHDALINKNIQKSTKSINNNHVPSNFKKCTYCSNPVASVSKLYCYDHLRTSYGWS